MTCELSSIQDRKSKNPSNTARPVLVASPDAWIVDIELELHRLPVRERNTYPPSSFGKPMAVCLRHGFDSQ